MNKLQAMWVTVKAKAASAAAMVRSKASAMVAKLPATGALGKVKSMLLALLPYIFGPVARLVGLGLAALAIVSSVYIKGRVEEHRVMVKHEQAALAEAKKEANNAIAAAEAARKAAEDQYARGRFDNRPSRVPGRVRHRSDGFSRD